MVCDFKHGQLAFKGEVVYRSILKTHEGQHLCVTRVLPLHRRHAYLNSETDAIIRVRPRYDTPNRLKPTCTSSLMPSGQ